MKNDLFSIFSLSVSHWLTKPTKALKIPHCVTILSSKSTWRIACSADPVAISYVLRPDQTTVCQVPNAGIQVVKIPVVLRWCQRQQSRLECVSCTLPSHPIHFQYNKYRLINPDRAVFGIKFRWLTAPARRWGRSIFCPSCLLVFSSQFHQNAKWVSFFPGTGIIWGGFLCALRVYFFISGLAADVVCYWLGVESGSVRRGVCFPFPDDAMFGLEIWMVVKLQDRRVTWDKTD